MAHHQREAFALRVITVSGQAALAKARTPAELERIKERIIELLTELEQSLGQGGDPDIVIRDGGDEGLLAAIDAERRRIYE